MAQQSSLSKPQVIKITDAALQRLRDIKENAESSTSHLRIGVKSGGCAGMEYTLEWIETPEAFDELVEVKGMQVYVKSHAVMFLLGTEMDYESTQLKSGFTFQNPNQTGACGCGESVQLKPIAV